MKTLLLVEDDTSFRVTVAAALKARSNRVREAWSPASAIASIEEMGAPDAILLDMRLGSESGMALIPRLRSACPESRLVVLTGYGSIPQAMEAIRHGADDYLLKPAGIDAIVAALFGCSIKEDPARAANAPSLARVEWEHIQRILHDCGGNVSHAARTLGIDRRTLQRKLAKIPPDE